MRKENKICDLVSELGKTVELGKKEKWGRIYSLLWTGKGEIIEVRAW